MADKIYTLEVDEDGNPVGYALPRAIVEYASQAIEHSFKGEDHTALGWVRRRLEALEAEAGITPPEQGSYG